MKTITLLGTNARAELKAGNLPFVYSPVFNNAGWNLDVFNYPSNMVPENVSVSESGALALTMAVRDEENPKERLMFVFSRKPHHAQYKHVKEGPVLDVGDWALPFQSMCQDSFHADQSMCPWHIREGQDSVQAVIVHVWKNADFDCKGHPEILHGAAMGQHHCGHCGEMCIAGLRHLSRAEIEEADREYEEKYGSQIDADEEDIPELDDPDAALDEGFALPAEDENQDEQ